MRQRLQQWYTATSEAFSSRDLAVHKPALYILIGTLGVIGVLWALVYAVDVLNMFDVASQRGLWWHLFRNRGPVEWLQWLFLSATFLLAAFLAGRASERNDRTEMIFWLLISVGFTLMLIEDAGDPRHLSAGYINEFTGLHRRYVETVYFMFIAAPLVYAWIRYRDVLLKYAATRLYVFAGGLLYGLAAVGSAMREYRSFYYVIGDWLTEIVTSNAIPGFFLIDFVLEESVELLGGALLFCAVLVYWRMDRETTPNSNR